MPGLSYALLPTGADAAAPRRVPRTVRQEPRDEPADSGADAVRRARQRGRLSRRELARRAGCSPTTIGRLEDGLDARWSTLARCIEMLPSLSPWSLLGLGEEQLSPDPARLWCFLRDLHGLEADEDFKTVAIAADGNSAIEIVTRNLRVLRSVPKELRLLLGLGVPVLQPTTAELQGVGHLSSASLEGQLRIAALTTADGARLHELRVPGIVAERGFSFGRRFRHAGIYALDSEQARARTGQEGPFHQGASLGSRFPVKRLRLRLRFPRGRRPPEVVPCAWSMAHAPDPGRDESLRALPARSVEVIEDRRRNAWELIAERPPVGVKFALAWFLD